MWFCYDCKRTTDLPDTYEECVGEYWGIPAFERFPCCPFCKGTDIEDIGEEAV